MEETIRRVTEWLKRHENRPITIRKQEDGDEDRVELRFQSAEVQERRTMTGDDYIDGKTILLHGQGSIQTDTEKADLPDDVYEIPLEPELDSTESGDRLQVQTGRGNYTLTAASE
jgi:hypothetical protein